MLLSGEISRIFRPDMSDMLAPLLMMKNIREEFPELVLACNSQSEQLFCEFEKLKVNFYEFYVIFKRGVYLTNTIGASVAGTVGEQNPEIAA